jgi:hypothetical protein
MGRGFICMSEPKYDIAVLLATRGRAEQLGRSIKSLLTLSRTPKKIQLFFAFDDDDTVGTEYFTKELKPWLDAFGAVYKALVFKRMGYVALHKYNNAMAKDADARWLMIWNDDAVMETPDWDDVIMSYEGQFKLLSFKTHNMHPYSIFPIVPKKWFELLGYISPHPTQDGWVSQQAYMLDIYQRIDVDVLHDRYDLTGNNLDATFSERKMLEGKPADPMDFHSIQQLGLRHSDCAKLAEYMTSVGVNIEFFENIFKGTQDPWEKLAANDPNSHMVQFKNPHTHFSK